MSGRWWHLRHVRRNTPFSHGLVMTVTTRLSITLWPVANGQIRCGRTGRCGEKRETVVLLVQQSDKLLALGDYIHLNVTKRMARYDAEGTGRCEEKRETVVLLVQQSVKLLALGDYIHLNVIKRMARCDAEGTGRCEEKRETVVLLVQQSVKLLALGITYT
ncbi:hypothetical protein J6590_008301 [Homalodisca vitripennis]|nr:hypothetical protein J6590_008301 [Homalodisca vitripennis]